MKINLIEYFNDTVNTFPDKIALVDENAKLTFSQLNERAKIIAESITSKVDVINCPIAIFLPKSTDAVASFLAILYSGNIYAPLDVKNPIERIRSILKVLNPCLIITNDRYEHELVKAGVEQTILNIDRIDSNQVQEISNFKKCIDTDPAYILHTSGSTGIPKGVVISHRAVIDYIHWVIDTFDVTDKEKIANQAPFIFDNSTLDIYLMVFSGASLYLTPERFFMFPQKLLEYLIDSQINFIFWVPSVLVHVANLNLLGETELPQLKKVLFAGEVMPTKHFNHWKHNLNDDVLFANLYGPTEITVDCTYYILDRDFEDDEPIPIGKPCRNTDILILNSEDQLCEVGEYGELCVRGSSLANGYWNNPRKTSSAFVQNPLNSSYPELIYRTGDIVYLNNEGNINYVGRKDFQIKHLGYRIELGEIEHAIVSIYDNLNACVVYDHNEKEIVLFYESKNKIEASDFKIKLSKKLSKYMIPTRFIKMGRLPKSASGKIDRNNLKLSSYAI